MSGSRSFVSIVVASSAVALLAAQAPAPPFRWERPVRTAGAGPHRLDVDLTLLAGARPFGRIRPSGRDGFRALDGLHDLRLFDSAGREIPYLQVEAPADDPVWRPGSLLRIAETKTTSGFEADLGASRTIDAVEVRGLRAPFLKRLRLEGSGDRERWTMLDAEGTLFDLPDERLRQTVVTFVPGAYRYLRVTWNDASSGRVGLPHAVFARIVAEKAIGRPALVSPVVVDRRDSEPGLSRYRIRLPAAQLPIVALILDVDARHIFRQARVLESQVSGAEAIPVELGRETLKRVERNGATADALRITIARPRESEIDLVVEDGANPPLNLRGASVEFAALPYLYFEAPAGEVVARYGNRSLEAPVYDLEAVRASLQPSQIRPATWEEPRPSSGATGADAPPPLPDTGAAIETGSFRHVREIENSPAGLAVLPLDASVLANSRGPAARFADVRIADTAGLQVPYLLERRDEPLSVDLGLRPAPVTVPQSAPGNRSAYALALPHANLPAARLVLETPERVFQRTVHVAVERPADRQHRDAWLEMLATRRWQHVDQQSPAPPLALPIPTLDRSEVIVLVEEGDNRALPLSRARLLLPSWRLRFYRPAREVRLFYGRDDLAPPKYDLALLAPQVMGAQARELKLSGADAPAVAARRLVSPRFFWVGLAIAVVVILAAIARLIVKAD